ncbi:MAG: hypothetical protein JW768_07055 [Chitinispirillaceae bacterium]|nr:hypothetical protein [Chitinispirillaceae bacterium]
MIIIGIGNNLSRMIIRKPVKHNYSDVYDINNKRIFRTSPGFYECNYCIKKEYSKFDSYIEHETLMKEIQENINIELIGTYKGYLGKPIFDFL